MRYILCALSFMVLLASHGWAQEFGLSLRYQFVQAKAWDDAVRTYNFSRPFLENKQPLLRNGFSFGLYYLPNTSASFSYGPAATFSFNQSSATNPNFDVDLRLFQLDLGCRLQVRPGFQENLQLSATPVLSGIVLARHVNGEIVRIGTGEESYALRTSGIGFGLQAEAGYDIPIGEQWYLTPTIGAAGYPRIWSGRGTDIFNESSAGDLQSNSSLFRFHAGMSITNRR